MRQFERYNHLNFLPWVGSNFAQGIGQHQLKLLVLGESHYCHDLGCGNCPSCSLENCHKLGYSTADFQNQTIVYIQDLVYSYSGAHYQQTGICFERAVMGKTLTQPEREDFWNRVIFYNFVQKCLPKKEGERTPITQNDLVGSEDAFREVLTTYKPDRVVVWGSRLFNILPDWNGEYSKITIEDGAQTDIWTYTVNEKTIPCMRVHHPSTPSGKSWEKWHKFYKEFLQLD